jgi:leucyl-tRNA synthetase
MNAKVLREALKTWLKLLTPIAPHICEELWSQTQEKCFISQMQWPQTDPKQKNPVTEERENLIKEVIDDTLNVLKATKITPKKICYYTAAQWKWKVYLKTLEKSMQGEVKMNDLMKELAADKELKRYMKEIVKFAAKITKGANALPKERKQTLLETRVLNESEAITNAVGFLNDRFKAQVAVYGEEDKNRYDPKQRSTVAMPSRPAIYIE